MAPRLYGQTTPSSPYSINSAWQIAAELKKLLMVIYSHVVAEVTHAWDQTNPPGHPVDGIAPGRPEFVLRGIWRSGRISWNGWYSTTRLTVTVAASVCPAHRRRSTFYGGWDSWQHWPGTAGRGRGDAGIYRMYETVINSMLLILVGK